MLGSRPGLVRLACIAFTLWLAPLLSGCTPQVLSFDDLNRAVLVADDQGACGPVGFVGDCSGSVLTWCEDSTLFVTDCAAFGGTCGKGEGSDVNDCLGVDLSQLDDCGDGKKISAVKVCDYHQDCANGSDELGCPCPSDAPCGLETPDCVACGVDQACLDAVCCELGDSDDDSDCDGVDDDCDGATDEAFEGITTSCGVGACASEGLSTCVAGEVQANCTEGQAADNDATCNGVDDDCDQNEPDGGVDEDYVVVDDCGVGYCGGGNETPSSCVDGVETTCDDGPQLSDVDTTCDGVDDDCDGEADDDYVPVTGCGVGYCGGDNETQSTCTAGVETPCEPGQSLSLDDATCDGVDDNCNGATDEDYVEVTGCGIGFCASTSSPSQCVEGAVISCVPGEPLTDDDLTCDGVDDNCNGATDEGYVPVTACGVGYCADNATPSSCNGGVVTPCDDSDVSGIAESICNGVDDDCDGQTDEDYVSVTGCGVGHCGGPNETASTCVAGVVTDCQPGDPKSLTDLSCDGVDDDCDGAVDDDYEAQGCGTGYCADNAIKSQCAGGVETPCAAASPLSEGEDATCDGSDDDCDGLVDEDYSQSQTCGLGPCENTVQLSCMGGVVTGECEPKTTAVALDGDDSCNAIDDDCDGVIDDDFGVKVKTCVPSDCEGTVTCDNGEEVDSCDFEGPLVDATCDDVDDDCDGLTDEDFEVEAQVCGTGVCVSDGEKICRNQDGETTGAAYYEDDIPNELLNTCVPDTSDQAADDSECNGEDDDCDGQTDEEFEEATTSCGVGVCASTGDSSCTAGVYVTNCTEGNTTGDDSDCDGDDDDCDGEADEHYVAPDTSCGQGVCQDQGKMICSGGSTWDTCEPKAPGGVDDANCDTLDNDCDGQSDEDFASSPAGQSVTCGAGACAVTIWPTCTDGAIENSCSPNAPAVCVAHGGTHECGDNGCGGFCGGASPDDYCITQYSDQHTCQAGVCVCVPHCAGKECGGDGCGGSCAPGCIEGFACSETGICLVDCEASNTTYTFDSGNDGFDPGASAWASMGLGAFGPIWPGAPGQVMGFQGALSDISGSQWLTSPVLGPYTGGALTLNFAHLTQNVDLAIYVYQDGEEVPSVPVWYAAAGNLSGVEDVSLVLPGMPDTQIRVAIVATPTDNPMVFINDFTIGNGDCAPLTCDSAADCGSSWHPCLGASCTDGYCLYDSAEGAACSPDSDPCTVDACDTGGQCSHTLPDTPLEGCCHSDADCTFSATEVSTCTDGLCVEIADGACVSDSDCASALCERALCAPYSEAGIVHEICSVETSAETTCCSQTSDCAPSVQGCAGSQCLTFFGTCSTGASQATQTCCEQNSVTFDFGAGDTSLTFVNAAGADKGWQLHDGYLFYGQVTSTGTDYDFGASAGLAISPMVVVPSWPSSVVTLFVEAAVLTPAGDTSDFLELLLYAPGASEPEKTLVSKGEMTVVASKTATPAASLETYAIDISDKAGFPIQLVWRFDTLNSSSNDFPGVFIKSMQIFSSCEAPGL